MRFLFLLITLFASVSITSSAVTDTEQRSFDSSYKTLRIAQNGNPLGFPVMYLHSDDRLTFSFDCLSEDRQYLRFRIIHCNADWKPSALIESEYLDGFNEGTVDDYDFSRATTVHYVHYSITLPDNNIKITRSGNYLLQIYDEGNPEKTLLQFRFYVSEQNVSLSGKITGVTDVDYNDAHQQLSFEIDCHNSSIENLFSDLLVIVEQNGRQDNISILPHPSRILGRKAIYEHLPQLIFKGGNEYRRFESVSTSFPSIGVEDIEYRYPYYRFRVMPDATRAYTQYLYDSTIHGKFFIREYDSSDSDTEADYVLVTFTLDAPYIPGREIFMEGDITERRTDNSSLMEFDPGTELYTKTLLLKQGQYNYQYLSRKNGGKLETAPLEGNHFQTVNSYAVRTYTRPRGERADRLIGYSILVSDHK